MLLRADGAVFRYDTIKGNYTKNSAFWPPFFLKSLRTVPRTVHERTRDLFTQQRVSAKKRKEIRRLSFATVKV